MAEMTTLDSATITAATQAELQQRMFGSCDEKTRRVGGDAKACADTLRRGRPIDR